MSTSPAVGRLVTRGWLSVTRDEARCEVLHGDALRVLPTLHGQADAIVTSPPYADQRTYDGTTRITVDGYADWLRPFLAAMLPCVGPAGSLMLNIGRLHRAGLERGIAEDARRAAQDEGWLWIDTIIWSKPNAFIAASAPYLHSTHEYVWWLSRSTDAYRGYDADTRTPHSETTLARYSQGFRTNRSKDGQRYHREGKPIAAPHGVGARPKSVQTFPSADHRNIAHPAPMSLKLARLLVSLSTPPGGVVLDPFAGSGTTGVAALERGRGFVGVEAHELYVREARRRLSSTTPSLFGEVAA